ncbi:MAG: hypothetical protein R3B57_14100 [Phycisphaerales bacterium]
MLLIDAYNVIGARWVLAPPLRPNSVPALLGLVARSRYARRRIRVVCDGRPGPEWRDVGILETAAGQLWTRLGRAEVLFSGRGVEADDVIEEILASRGGLSILLVSSDRRLIRAAGQAGADQIGNGSFLRQLGADLGGGEEEVPAMVADVPLDRHAVEGWMREFGIEPPREKAPEVKPEPPASKAPPASEPPEFGERLRIALPADPPPEAPARAPKTQAETPPEAEPLDPLLAQAFEEWRGRLSADDLDMSRWIQGVEPIRGNGGHAGRGRRRR